MSTKIDVDGARAWLREALPPDEGVEIEDPDLLDAAAAVIVLGGGPDAAA